MPKRCNAAGAGVDIGQIVREFTKWDDPLCTEWWAYRASKLAS